LTAVIFIILKVEARSSTRAKLFDYTIAALAKSSTSPPLQKALISANNISVLEYRRNYCNFPDFFAANVARASMSGGDNAS
jgi:hypothetical protein